MSKREPEMCLNTYTTILLGGGGGIRKLCRNCGGAALLLGVATCLETPFPAIPPLDFFPGNMETVSNEHDEVSIRIYHDWKKDRAANGTQICWLDACTGAINRTV